MYIYILNNSSGQIFFPERHQKKLRSAIVTAANRSATISAEGKMGLEGKTGLR